MCARWSEGGRLAAFVSTQGWCSGGREGSRTCLHTQAWLADQCNTTLRDRFVDTEEWCLRSNDALSLLSHAECAQVQRAAPSRLSQKVREVGNETHRFVTSQKCQVRHTHPIQRSQESTGLRQRAGDPRLV
uniref:Uncharacterized protein n=1 Tax=Knipowitschia caucasica TaxID=637954 RepID=A0AAV2J654_KNICA